MPEALKEMSFLQKIRFFWAMPPEWALVLRAVIYVYALYCLFLFMTGMILLFSFNDLICEGGGTLLTF